MEGYFSSCFWSVDCIDDWFEKKKYWSLKQWGRLVAASRHRLPSASCHQRAVGKINTTVPHRHIAAIPFTISPFHHFTISMAFLRLGLIYFIDILGDSWPFWRRQSAGNLNSILDGMLKNVLLIYSICLQVVAKERNKFAMRPRSRLFLAVALRQINHLNRQRCRKPSCNTLWLRYCRYFHSLFQP